MKDLRFNEQDAQSAADGWGFNCGPGALCALLGLRPEDLRPVLSGMGFEKKRYMSPTMMQQALMLLRANVRPHPKAFIPAAGSGLIRVQWDGPWMQRTDADAWREQYRHTHWVGYRADPGLPGEGRGVPDIFDINAIIAGGWIDYDRWRLRMVPWLLSQCGLTAKGATGGFSFTHVWEIFE